MSIIIRKTQKLVYKDSIKSYQVAYILELVANWIFISLAPIIILNKFSSATSIVNALTLRVVPQVLFAPYVARAITKYSSFTVGGLAISLIYLFEFFSLEIQSYNVFLLFSATMGLLRGIRNSSVQSMRSKLFLSCNLDKVTKANANLAVFERLFMAFCPVLAIHVSRFFSIKVCVLFSLFIGLCAAIIFSQIKRSMPTTNVVDKEAKIYKYSYFELWKVLFKEKGVLDLLIPLFCYALIAGGLNIFLFFIVKDILLWPSENWSYFLTAKGVGALISAIIIPKLNKRTNFFNKMSNCIGMNFLNYFLYSLIAVKFSTSFIYTILFICGFLEVLCTVSFFNLLQKNIQISLHPLFHSCSLPIYMLISVIGRLCMHLYSSSVLTLKSVWLMVCSFPIFFITLFILYKWLRMPDTHNMKTIFSQS